MRPVALLLTAAALQACQKDETVRAYGGGDRLWVLTEIDDTPFPARATLRFPEPGLIAGEAPCNSYRAEMTVPYPWFEAGPIIATRRGCADLAAETRFLEALGRASLSEVAGDVLLLTDPDGLVMVFRADG